MSWQILKHLLFIVYHFPYMEGIPRDYTMQIPCLHKRCIYYSRNIFGGCTLSNWYCSVDSQSLLQALLLNITNCYLLETYTQWPISINISTEILMWNIPADLLGKLDNIELKWIWVMLFMLSIFRSRLLLLLYNKE